MSKCNDEAFQLAQAHNQMETYADIIESYKKPITMPAKYLEVFSVVYKDFFSDECDNKPLH
jgi:hypothetical protein